MIRNTLLILNTLIVLSACSFFDKDYAIENPILEVDGFSVSQEAFDKLYIRHLIATGANDTKEERYNYLQKITDKLVLGKEAIESGILNDEPVKATLEREKKKAYRDFYFLDAMNGKIPPVTEEEFRNAYARKQQKVYVRQLFFRDMNQAEEYHKRLEKGEKFINLANELYQTAVFDSTAGYLGEMSYFSIEDKYAEVAFSLKAGEYSKPFRNRWGIYIIKVENKTTQPLLAESQLNLAKKGVRSQVKLRKQRLLGDQFIDSLMRTTNPRTNEGALLMIHDYLRDLHQGKMIRLGESNKDKVRFNIFDSDLLTQEFDENIELLQYQLNGENLSITVGDFAKWIPELLPSEVINRPGASLGRVLRNEVMYELGKQKGYDSDKRVNYDFDLRTKLFAADLVMEDLIQSIRLDSSSIDEEAFNSFIKSRSSYEWNITYWAKSYPSLSIAQKEQKKMIGENETSFIKDGFKRYSETMSSKHIKYKMLKDATLNQWQVGADNDGVIYVYLVTQRESIEKKFETDQRYKVLFRSYNQISSYVDSLRKLSTIKVDTVRFENAMNLD